MLELFDMDKTGSVVGVSGVWAVAGVLGAVSVASVSLINHEQPEPYMVRAASSY